MQVIIIYSIRAMQSICNRQSLCLVLFFVFRLFFSERTEAFVRHWLNNTLGTERYWYYHEYAVIRSAIQRYVLHDHDHCYLSVFSPNRGKYGPKKNSEYRHFLRCNGLGK